jgi:hypothetical protein
MKHLHTFENFLNESVVNEAKGKPTKDSPIIDHYGKTIKQVLEHEDGENEYLTIQFTDNTEMYITAYPTGNGGVGLVVESVNEAIDTKYWADYNKDTSGQGNKDFADKSKNFDDTFDYAVEDWNNEADGPENKIKGAAIGKIQKMAKEFFKKEGWISVNVVQAMIMQDGAMTESANINESSIQYFKPTVLDKKNAVDSKLFKKLMPRTSSTTEEAMERIWHFEDSTMFAHYQYHIVKPNGNKPNRPTYRLHQSQYWLSGAYDNQIKNLGLDPKEGVNTTLVTIFDITDPANEINLGKVWVDTRQFLDEMNRVFEVIRRES